MDCILPADFIACSFLESQLHSFDDEQVFATVPFLASLLLCLFLASQLHFAKFIPELRTLKVD